MAEVKLLIDAKATLGEGPAWDANLDRLYWVDILEKRLHYFDGVDHNLLLDDYIGCVAPSKDGRLVLALRYGIWTLDLDAKDIREIAVPHGEPLSNRFNDGKCDPAGRFLAGTMDFAEREANGILYSLTADGKLSTLLTGLRISNGMTWSPDHATFYFIDTPSREVKAFDYDLKTGEIANPRLVVSIPESLGWPDGMTSDVEGHLWIAMWAGAQVTCWDPAGGKLLDRVAVPALNVTSCVFGGRDMNELYITSARKGMEPSGLSAYPFSGGVFKYAIKTTGMPTYKYGT